MFDQVKNLVHTSVDDCRISLQFVTDVNLIREALTECVALGYKSKVQHLSRRLRQIEKDLK